MKPKALKIFGLNSFESEQTIKFDKLTEKGLFGIFGPTGSGKSTILDAITIALYGKIMRTNSGYINTTTRDLKVSYEFEIGIGKDRKIYIAERNIKINKRGGYNTKYARLIEKMDEEQSVIAEGPNELQEQVEKIIGLTVEDFTRSVVLPQGRFSDFLKLKGKDKRNMLERIFGLEKYGKMLGDKIKSVKNKHLKKYDILTGQLKKYEGLTEEEYNKKEIELDKLVKEEEKIKQDKKKLQEDYEKYKEVWELQQELKEILGKRELLESKKIEIDNKRKLYVKAQNAIKVNPYIVNFHKTEFELQENIKELNEVEIILKEIDDKLNLSQQRYDEIVRDKDELVPILIKEENNLTRAIELNDKVKLIEKERDGLREKFKKLDIREKELLKNIEELSIKKEKELNTVNNIENRLKLIKIDPTYRQKIMIGLDKENEYNRLLKTRNELHEKLCKNDEILDEMVQRYNKILKIQQEKNKLVEELKIKNNFLNDSHIDYNKLILTSSEKINKLNITLDKALKNRNRKDEIENIILNINSQKQPLENKIFELNNKLAIYKMKLDNIKTEIEDIKKKNLASILAIELEEGKACPVCGSCHHINKAKAIDIKNLNEKENKKSNLEILIDKLKDDLNKNSLEFMKLQNEEEHIKKEYDLILEELKDIDIESLIIQKEDEENTLAKFKNDMKKSLEETKVLKEQLDKSVNDKVSTDMMEAKLNENIKGERILISELQKELIKEEENIEKILQEYLCIKKELNIENIKSKVNEINEFEDEREVLENDVKELRNLIENYTKQILNLTTNVSEIDIEIGKITQSGKEKSYVIKAYEEEIKKICNEKEPDKALEKVISKIQFISKQYDKLKIQLDKDKSIRENILNEKLALSKENKMLELRKKEQLETLELQLKENSFKNSSEAIEVLLDKEELLNIEKEIDGFDDNVKEVRSNITRIQLKLDDKRIDEDKWAKIKKDVVEIEELSNTKIKEIATLQKIIEDFKNDLSVLRDLRKQNYELEHKLSLLNDITKLVEGNKFVEFVATNRLKYIAREASRRLKEITRERYALEIDSECNFKIRDDFNGGEIRETSTLSGGETFLTSLALALALSSQVQLKGSAPLEFFFLDEGFGTLDNNLLDVVMNSLERLHNSKLSIGIISHVEELKNRVPIKLIVTPAIQGECGSKINLEFS